MATIQSIKSDNNAQIRAAAGAGSITKGIDANMRDVVADELAARGVLKVANTGALNAISRHESSNAFIAGLGVFCILATGVAADNDTTFPSADAGYLWEHVIDTRGTEMEKTTANANAVRLIKDGTMSDKIMLKPSVNMTLKIGTTNGGEEVLVSVDVLAGKWYSVSYDIIADGADISIYINGITANCVIIIYKKKL